MHRLDRLIVALWTLSTLVLGAAVVLMGVKMAYRTEEPDYTTLQRATVLVAFRYAGEVVQGGTGVIVDEGILTAGHVALAAPKDGELLVTYHDGTTVEATIADSLYTGSEKQIHRDLALLEAPGMNRRAEAPVSCEAMQTGESLFVVGHPAQLRWAVTEGNVLTERPPVGHEDGVWLSTDATIWKGASGGPVFNAQGYLVGVVTSTSMSGVGGSTGYGRAQAPGPVCDFLREGGS